MGPVPAVPDYHDANLNPHTEAAMEDLKGRGKCWQFSSSQREVRVQHTLQPLITTQIE